MHTQKPESLRRRFWGAVVAFAGMAIMLIISGCATVPSSFKPSYRVTSVFGDFRPIPGYRYFYSGTRAKPLGVLALKPGITLETKGWQPVAAERREIDPLIENMQLVPWVEYNVMPNGAYIIDPNNQKVGVFYSVYRFPRITFKNADTIDIAIPEPVLRSTNRSWTGDKWDDGSM